MHELPEKYDSNNWKKQLHFEKLKPKFEPLLKGFQSYQNDLKDFLVDDALRAEEISISTTFLVFDAKQWHYWLKKKKLSELDLLGYVTVLCDSIRLDGDLKEQFRKKGIEYKSLPALKIGRLCVDDRYLRRHIGSCMIAWAASKVAYLNLHVSCRFITLDAKRHSDSAKDSYHFYKKLGFKVLKRKDKSDKEVAKQATGHTSMYIDLYHIIEALKKKKSL